MDRRTGSRTKNTIRNMSFGMFGKMINLVLPFIIRTIILQKMGAEYAGLGSLFISILQVLSVAELGFSSAIIFSLYRPVAENNRQEICQWLTLYRRIYHIVGISILGAGLVILPFLRFLIHGSYPENINLYILYLIYLTNTVISYFAFSYKNAILIVYQRRDILSLIEMAVNICRSAIQIMILLTCNDYYLYIIWLPIFTLITNLLVEYVTKKKFPELVCEKKVKKEKLDEISDQIKGVAIGKISFVARNTFDSIILSALCGLHTVAMYSNYYLVLSSVGALLAVVIQSMSASIGNSIAVEEIDKNKADHDKFDFYYMWIVGWCTVCMVCMYQPFMNLWVGKELVFPFHTMVLFCVYFYINQLSQIRSIYSEAAGLWWKFRYITMAEMAANFFLNFIMGYFWEADGIIFATIITAFLSSFVGITIITYKSYFKSSAGEYFYNNIVYAVVTFVVALLAMRICGYVKRPDISGLLYHLSICAFFPNIVYLGIYMLMPRYRLFIREMIHMLYRKTVRR